jgi:hypothetical protein
MSADKQSASDATPALRGIIYQFYVVLLCLHKLKPGEKVLIEWQGDVSVLKDLETDDPKGQKQIEVKHYDDVLTDQHINFWKTLKNWVCNEEVSENYAALILHTTQAISSRSKLINWNSADVESRVLILKDIHEAAMKRYSNTLATDQKAAKSESHLCIDRVCSDIDRLRRVLGKIAISGDQPKSVDFLNQIIHDLAYNIPEENRRYYIYSLLGLILNPPQENEERWQISESDFRDFACVVTGRFAQGSTEFPRLQNRELVMLNKISAQYRFVDKILTIGYDRPDVLNEAIDQYRLALSTIIRCFKGRPIDEERVEHYQESLLAVYHPQRRSAVRTSTVNEWRENSQQFYDNIMSLMVMSFPETVGGDKRFQNGMFHLMADDNSADVDREVKWDLREDKS